MLLTAIIWHCTVMSILLTANELIRASYTLALPLFGPVDGVHLTVLEQGQALWVALKEADRGLIRLDRGAEEGLQEPRGLGADLTEMLTLARGLACVVTPVIVSVVYGSSAGPQAAASAAQGDVSGCHEAPSLFFHYAPSVPPCAPDLAFFW